MHKLASYFEGGWRKNIANALSIIRPITSGVLFGFIAYWLAHNVAIALWVALTWALIASTDKLDGWFANHPNFGSTKIGPTLDQMSDKFMIIPALIILARFGRIEWYFAAIMIARDVLSIYIRWSVKDLEKSPVEKALDLGKLKMVYQCILVFAVLLPGFPGQATIVYLLSAFATGLSIVSGLEIWILAEDAKSGGEWLKGTNGVIRSANWVSMIRIALALIIPTVYAFQPFGRWSNFAALVMLAAAIYTDKLDGDIATTKNQITKAGVYLDPLGDKMMFYPALVGMFIAGAGNQLLLHELPIWLQVVFWIAAAIIAVRDLGFFGWFVAKGMKLDDMLPSEFFDKCRFVVLCVLLGALALLMVLPLDSVVGFCLWLLTYVCFGFGAVLSVITIKTGIARYKEVA